MSEEMQYRVLADYEVNDPHPLVVRAKTAVRALRTDPGWPGWVWVESEGQTGWIAEAFLDTDADGTLRTNRDYNGTELSAKRDEILTELESRNGWIMARSEAGETGWFPLFNLRPRRST